MKELIIWLNNAQLLTPVYYVFHVLGFISCFISAVLVGKKIGVSTRKAVGLVLIALPILYVWMFVMFWAESGFQSFGGNNIVRVFVYLPLMGLFVAKMLKMRWQDSFHLLSVAPLAIHGVAHFGCILFGCCHGYPSTWGFYNLYKDQVLFPIQPIEAIAAWVIVAIIMLRTKRNGNKADGLELPIMLVLFGFSRFFFEYLRDNYKLWNGISDLAFHALFMGVVGVILYVVLRIKMRRQANPA